MHETLEGLRRRIRDEFVEMPGCRSPRGQAARLWQLDPRTADACSGSWSRRGSLSGPAPVHYRRTSAV